MIVKEIMFEPIDYGFTGRNGTFKCAGLHISSRTPADKDMIILPYTSKGEIGNCQIKFPKECIPEIIEHLLTIKEEYENNKKNSVESAL